MHPNAVICVLSLWALQSMGGILFAAEPAFAKLQNFEEKINTDVNVSGHVVVGLMGEYAFQGVQREKLAVGARFLKRGDQFCLRVSSRDGVYSMDGRYTFENNTESELMLAYPTLNRDIVAGFERDNVALAVNPGRCGSNRLTFLLPHLSTAFPTEVLLAINGFQATDVFFSIESTDGVAVDGECEYIEEGRHTAYDFMCSVPLPEGGAPYDLKIERELYGREMPVVKLQLLP